MPQKKKASNRQAPVKRVKEVSASPPLSFEKRSHLVSLLKSRKELAKFKSYNNQTIVGGKAEQIEKNPIYSIRQLCFPSATTMSVSGTGVSYTAASGTILGATTTGFFSLYFMLGDFSQAASEFGPLVDQYRIPKVRVHIYPGTNTSTSTTTQNPPVYTVVDYDDSTVLSTINGAFEYQNVEIHSPYKPFTLTLKPRQAVASGSGFLNIPTGWVDMANQTVAHYGIKGVLPFSYAANYVVIVEAEIQLRSVR